MYLKTSECMMYHQTNFGRHQVQYLTWRAIESL